MSNLIIGNKYVPISKSIFGPLNSSSIWEKAQKLNQPYLYYVGKNENDLCFSHVKNDALSSDFFLESDVIPYEEEFVLPLEWCIKVTVENVFDISKWRGDSDLIRWGDFTGYLHSNKVWASDVKKSIEISYEQFKTHVLKITNMLPKKWFIERNEKNYKVVNKWAEDQKLTKANYNATTGYIYSEPVNNKNHRLSCTDDYNLLEHNLFTEINFEQFQEFVLKIKTNNMKQIGWKFKPNQDQFIKAACAIVSYLPYGTSTINSKVLKFEFDEESIEKLRDADVLELWFEPVYEDKFKVGDWVYIKNTDTSVSYSRYYGCEVGHVAQIEKIDFEFGNATAEDPRYYGNKFNVRGESLRKATAEEIELYDSVDIAGYKAEKVKDGIKFGCQTIPMSVLDALENLMERDVFTTTLKIESTDITLDIIKKLKNL